MAIQVINPDAIQSDASIAENLGDKYISATAIIGWRLMSDKKVVWVHSNKVNEAFNYLPMSNFTMTGDQSKKYAEFLVSARLHDVTAKIIVGDITREFERLNNGNEAILLDNSSIEDSDRWIDYGTKAKKSENSYIGPMGRRNPNESSSKIKCVGTDAFAPGTNPIPYGSLREKLNNTGETTGDNLSGQLAAPMQWHKARQWDNSTYYEFKGLLPNSKMISGYTPSYAPKCFLINGSSKEELNSILECLWFVPEKRLGWSTYRIWHKVKDDFEENANLIAWTLSANNSDEKINQSILNLQKVLNKKANIDDFFNNSLFGENLVIEDQEENSENEKIWDEPLSQGVIHSEKNQKIQKIKNDYEEQKEQLVATGVLVRTDEQKDLTTEHSTEIFNNGSWEIIEKTVQGQELKDLNFISIEKNNLDIKNIKFENCKFNKCNFSSLIFDKIIFVNCEFIETKFDKAVFIECNIEYCKFINSDSMFIAFEKSSLINTVVTNISDLNLNFNHSTIRSFILKECIKTTAMHFNNSKVDDLSLASVINAELKSSESTVKDINFKKIKFTNFELIKSNMEKFLIGQDVEFEKMVIDNSSINLLAANDRFIAKQISCVNSTISGGMRNSTISDSSFIYSKLYNVAISEASLKNCQFNNCDLQNTKLNSIRWSGVIFENSDLDQAKFNSAVGEGIIFKNCNLNDASINDLTNKIAFYDNCILPELKTI
jgi:uncharacterized protein YjbI with pentapeptide repeats